MPAKHITLKEYLILEDEDNITLGLRQAISAIKAGWKSPAAEVASLHKKTLKKLDQSQHRKLVDGANRTLDLVLRTPRTPVDMTNFLDTLRTKDEASAAYATFIDLSVGADEINRQFQHAAEAQGIITRQEADGMIAAVHNGVGSNFGPNNDTFITSHRDFIKRVLAIDAPTIAFKVDAGSELLEMKLKATPKDAPGADQKAAVKHIFYLLLIVRRQLAHAAAQIHALPSKKNLPDQAS